jgi:hypothetical protein
MFWVQEDDLLWKLYRNPADEGNENAAGSVEFRNDTQMWVGLDYTKPDDSNAGCALLGPFLTEEEAQDAVEKSLASSRPADAERRASSTN